MTTDEETQRLYKDFFKAFELWVLNFLEVKVSVKQVRVTIETFSSVPN